MGVAAYATRAILVIGGVTRGSFSPLHILFCLSFSLTLFLLASCLRYRLVRFFLQILFFFVLFLRKNLTRVP